MVKINILVDYLTISLKAFCFDDIIKLCNLNKDNMIEIKSYFGMNICYLYCGIKIHVGEYIILDMSGQGCRTLETLLDKNIDWINFIEKFLSEEGSHIARLDIACDDKPKENELPILSFPNMVKHLKERKYISIAKRKIYVQGDEENIVFGSPSSDRRLRIYNKAMERDYDGHWIRAEFQLRNDTALSFYMRALELHSIGQAYQGMLYDYLRFTNEINDDNHTERKTVCKWWLKFCGTAKKIKGFYIGGLEYNMQSLEQWLSKSVSSSLKTYLIAKEGDFTKLDNMINSSSLNKKQEFLIKTEELRKQIDKKYNYEFEIMKGLHDLPFD